MHMPHLGKRDQFYRGPVAGVQDLLIDPPRRVGVPLNLEVVGELLVTYGTALAEKDFYLPESESVALDRRGVVDLLEPDVSPDVLSLVRRGQPTETRAKLLDTL